MIPALGIGAVIAWLLKPCKKQPCKGAEPSFPPVISRPPALPASVSGGYNYQHPSGKPPPLSATVVSSGGYGLQPATFSPPISPLPPPRPASALPPPVVPRYNYAPSPAPNIPQSVLMAANTYAPPPSYNYVPPEDQHQDVYIMTANGGFSAHWNGAGYVSSDDTGDFVGTAIRPHSVPGRPDGEILTVVKQNGLWQWD